MAVPCCSTMLKHLPPTTEPKWCLTPEDFSILRWISQYISGIYSNRGHNLQCSCTGAFRPDVLPRCLINKSVQDPKDNDKIQWSSCQRDSSGLEDGIPWHSQCPWRVIPSQGMYTACASSHTSVLTDQLSSVTYCAWSALRQQSPTCYKLFSLFSRDWSL
jgi:hypothetical protein